MPVNITNPSTVTAGSAFTVTGTGFGASQGGGSVTIEVAGGTFSDDVTMSITSWSDTSIVVAASTLAAVDLPLTSATYTATLRVTNNAAETDTQAITYAPPSGYAVVEVPRASFIDAVHSAFWCLKKTGPFGGAGDPYQLAYQTTSAAGATISIATSGIITSSGSNNRAEDTFALWAWIGPAVGEANSELVNGSYWWSPEAKLIQRIRQSSGLNAVGSRVYRNMAPQNAALPFIAMYRVAAERESAMGIDPGNVAATIQVSCFATSAATARAVADSVRGQVQRFRSNPIEDVFVVGEFEAFDRDTQRYQHVVDLRVHYREA